MSFSCATCRSRLGCTEQHHPARAELVRRPHLRAQAPGLVVDGDRAHGAADPRHLGGLDLQPGVGQDDDLGRRLRDHLRPTRRHHLGHAVKAAREADTGVDGHPSASASPSYRPPATSASCCPDAPAGIELEDGARVVVEAAHEVRVQPVLDARGVEHAPHQHPCRGALLAQVVGDARRFGLERLALRHLAVEQAQRVGLEPPLAVAVQLVLQRPVVLAQQLEVGRPALEVADRVQLQRAGR